jgi:hypothetical protein
VDELTDLALGDGISAFILGSDDPAMLTTYAEDVVPAVREAVAAGRSAPQTAGAVVAAQPSRVEVQPATAATTGTAAPASAETSAFPVATTPDDGTRLTESRWDESTRPSGPAPEPSRHYTSRDLASGQQLVDIHNHLRAELTQIRDLVAQVLEGSTDPAAARSSINEMTLRQNNWTVGAYCAAYCRLVTTHHSIEDQALFPRLRRSDPQLAPVVDRLHWEHEVIHEVLQAVDHALVAFVGPEHDGEHLQLAVDQLTDTLLSHLSYEERELVEPIARLGILV